MLARLRNHVDALGSVTLRAAGVGFGFLLSVFIGVRWGAEAAGLYALVTQSAMFLSIVAVGGLDLALVRHFGKSSARERVAVSSQLSALGVTLAMAGAVIGMLFLVGPDVRNWLTGTPLTTFALTIMIILLIARAMTRSLSAVLRVQRRFMLAQAVEIVLIPMFVTAALLAGWLHSPDALLIATALAAGLVVAIGFAAMVQGMLVRSDLPATKVSIRTLLATGGSLWMVAVALNLADWYGLATVASVGGLDAAGVFRVAAQMAAALGIVSTGLFGVYTAKMSAAFGSNDLTALAQLYRQATKISIVLILPATLVLALFAEPLLGLIGPEFVSGSVILRILLAGQFIATVMGPAGMMLAMTGNEKSNLRISLVAIILLVVAAPLLGDIIGAAGVALAIAIAQSGRNIASAWSVWRKFKLAPLGPLWSRAKR